MIKCLITIVICLLIQYIDCYGQTRQTDYDYIIEHYTDQKNNNNYKKKDLLSSVTTINNGIKVSIQFTRFITIADNKNRGIAIVYKQKRNNNELLKTLVYCLPEKNSSNDVIKKSQENINNLDDPLVSKYILMGLMELMTKNI